MIAPEYFNNHIAVEGEIIVKRVPNDTGSVVVWNSSTKKLSIRTHAEIVSDLKIMTTHTEQNVEGVKWFRTAGGNAYLNHRLRIISEDGSNPGMVFYKSGANAGTLQYDGSHYIFTNSDTNEYGLVLSDGYKKSGSSDNNVLLGGGGHKPLSDLGTTHTHQFLYSPDTGSINANNLLEDYNLNFNQRVESSSTNMFPVVNNANSITSIASHPGGYGNQLGFNGNEQMFFRSVSAGTYNGWKEFAFKDWVTNNKVSKTGDTMTGNLKIEFPNGSNATGASHLSLTAANLNSTGMFFFIPSSNVGEIRVGNAGYWGTIALQPTGGNATLRGENIATETWVNTNYWAKYTSGSNSGINTANPFSFYNANAAQKVYMGGLLVSSAYSDSTNIPANGIYSKGDVLSAGKFTGTGFLKTGSSDNYLLLGGGGHKLVSDFASNLYRPFLDNRSIKPINGPVTSIQYGFTSYGNNSTSPYADYIHFGGYSDATGGNQNLLVIKRSGFGIRQFQAPWQDANPYTNFVDYWNTGNFNPDLKHSIDLGNAINNGSDVRTNKSWFDYDWAATGQRGSVINFSGLNSKYSTELFGSYDVPDKIGIRTRNGDTNSWNAPKWLWHNNNFNPDSKVNKAGDTMTGNLIVPNVVLSSNSLLSNTLNGSQIIAALIDTMYVGNAAGLDYLNFQSKYGLTHYQNGVAGSIWTSHNFNPDSKIPTSHPSYGITAYNIGNWLGYLRHDYNMLIQPNQIGNTQMQFGFGSWNNNNSGPFADYLHFGGYIDSSGGNQNLIMFSKNGFGLRQWQGTKGSPANYTNFVDYWNTGNFTQTNVDSWNNMVSNYVTLNTVQHITNRKFFDTYGNNWSDNSLIVYAISPMNPAMTFYKEGVGIGQIMFDGSQFNLKNSENSGYQYIRTEGFIKSGSDNTYLLLGGGGHKPLSDYWDKESLPDYRLYGLGKITDGYNININEQRSTGFYSQYAGITTGTSPFGYATILHQAYMNSNEFTQIAIQKGAVGMAFRNEQTDWNYLWHNNNFNPNDKVNKSGDTMSGGLIISSPDSIGSGNPGTLPQNYKLFLANTGATPKYGTVFWTESDGKGYIQQQRSDGQQSAYRLNLQPYGGELFYGNSEVATHSYINSTLNNYVTTNSIQTIYERKTINKDLGTNDYLAVAQHNAQFQIGKISDAKSLEFAVMDNGTSIIQSKEVGVGYNALILNPSNGGGVAIGGSPATGHGLSVSTSVYSVEGYYKQGYNNNYILLAGGGHKPISDFALSSQLGNYLLLSGGTLTGPLTSLNITTQNIFGNGLTGNQILSNGTDVIYFGNPNLQNVIIESANNDIFHSRAGHGLGKIWDAHNFNPDTKVNISDLVDNFISKSIIFDSNFDNISPNISGIYRADSYAPGVKSIYSPMLHMGGYDTKSQLQIQYANGDDSVTGQLSYRGGFNNTWGVWRTAWDNVNLSPVTLDTDQNISGQKIFKTLFDTYTPDGLFDSSARPLKTLTPNGAKSILLGYKDYGSGQYYPRIGFISDTNWSIGPIGNDFTIGKNNDDSNILKLTANGEGYLNSNIIYHAGNFDPDLKHSIDRGYPISNGSDVRTNKSWFDYDWAGTGQQGSVINFSGLNSKYSTELFGSYNFPDKIGIRTRNGDTNSWNAPRWLWNSGNFNPDTKVNKAGDTMTGTLKLEKGLMLNDPSVTQDWSIYQTPTGINFYVTGGTNQGDVISLEETGKITTQNTVNSNGFIKNGSNDSYVLLGGGGHKAVSDFALASQLGSFVTKNTDQTIEATKTIGFQNTIYSGWDRSSVNNPQMGPFSLLNLALQGAYPLYGDEEFRNGSNSIIVYNNYGNGTVTMTREAASDLPNRSGIQLRFNYNGNGATPGLGGFILGFNARPNAIFIQKFMAKLPVGYAFNNAENYMGDNASVNWLTSRAGTGKWETYVRAVICGTGTSFGNGGHVYVEGPDTAMEFRLAFAEIYEINSSVFSRIKESFYTKNETIHFNGGIADLITVGDSYAQKRLLSTSWDGTNGDQILFRVPGNQNNGAYLRYSQSGALNGNIGLFGSDNLTGGQMMNAKGDILYLGNHALPNILLQAVTNIHFNYAGTGSIYTFNVNGVYLDRNINFNLDNSGINFYEGGKIYKKAGGGIYINKGNNGLDPKVENADGSQSWAIFHEGNHTPFKNLRGGAVLEEVSESGIYRQEGSTSGFNYTTTLNMNSSDGRQQLTIERSGSGMKFRGSYYGSGNQGWSDWKDVIHSGNITAYINSYGFTTQSALNVQLSGYATLNGVQTFTNTNTFTSSPVIPNGTLGTHAVNKNQIQLNTGTEGENGQQLTISGNNSVNLTNFFVTSRDGSRNPDDIAPNSTPKRVRFDFSAATTAGLGGSGNYAGIMTYSPWDGTSASTGDSSYQLAFANQTGVNGSGIPMLKIRKGIDGNWTSAWYKFWTQADFTITNIQQWNHISQFGLQLNQTFSSTTGYDLMISDDYFGNESGLVDAGSKNFVAGRINEYYKYGSNINGGLEGINYHLEMQTIGIGGEADKNKVSVKGCVKATRNFKSEEERPDTLFIPNGHLATLRDEIVNDESDYAMRLDPHEYEIDSSGNLEINDRNRLIHIIGEEVKMSVNFREIYPKQQIVIYNFDQKNYPMAVLIKGKQIYNIEPGGFLRLYVTKSLRVIAERQQPCEMIY